MPDRQGTQRACCAQVPEEQRGELCQAHEEELTAQYEAEAAATRPPLEAAVQRSAEEASVIKQCALHPSMLWIGIKIGSGLNLSYTSIWAVPHTQGWHGAQTDTGGQGHDHSEL